METPTLKYLDPLPANVVIKTMEELFQRPGEREIAWSAVQFFFEKFTKNEKDRAALQRQWKRLGPNMFIWKYYRSARHYVGGVEALSAHLYLRGL